MGPNCNRHTFPNLPSLCRQFKIDRTWGLDGDRRRFVPHKHIGLEAEKHVTGEWWRVGRYEPPKTNGFGTWKSQSLKSGNLNQTFILGVQNVNFPGCTLILFVCFRFQIEMIEILMIFFLVTCSRVNDSIIMTWNRLLSQKTNMTGKSNVATENRASQKDIHLPTINSPGLC